MHVFCKMVYVCMCWRMRAECGSVCISLFFVCVQRLIMCWAKDLENREIKLLCPNFCHRFLLVMQSSAGTHTAVNQWRYKMWSYLVFFKPKKSIYSLFIGLSLDLRRKWLTSHSCIQRHKRILQHIHLTTKRWTAKPKSSSNRWGI